MTDARYCAGCEEIQPTEEGAVNVLCAECGAAIKPKSRGPDR